MKEELLLLADVHKSRMMANIEEVWIHTTVLCILNLFLHPIPDLCFSGNELYHNV
jgi:hypothetical protein